MHPSVLKSSGFSPYLRGPKGPSDERPRKQMRLRRCVACHFGMICESRDEMFVSCGNRRRGLCKRYDQAREGAAFARFTAIRQLGRDPDSRQYRALKLEFIAGQRLFHLS